MRIGKQDQASMLEAMSYFNLDSFTHYFSVEKVLGRLSRPVVSQSYTFECAGGNWIAFHLSSPPKFWDGHLQATGPQIGEFTTVRAPYAFDGAYDFDISAPPLLDEHGEEIRKELKRRHAS